MCKLGLNWSETWPPPSYTAREPPLPDRHTTSHTLSLSPTTLSVLPLLALPITTSSSQCLCVSSPTINSYSVSPLCLATSREIPCSRRCVLSKDCRETNSCKLEIPARMKDSHTLVNYRRWCRWRWMVFPSCLCPSLLNCSEIRPPFQWAIPIALPGL